jgi:hypothetical protein
MFFIVGFYQSVRIAVVTPALEAANTIKPNLRPAGGRLAPSSLIYENKSP